MITPAKFYDDSGRFAPVFIGTSAERDGVPQAHWGPDDGDLWYDTANDIMKIFNGTSWVGIGTAVARPKILAADEAAITISAEDSGRMHIIPDLDADTVFTLPDAAAGLSFKFAYGGVAADAHDWQFDTGSDTNFFLGGFVELDTSGDTVVLEAPDGDSHSIVNILTPAPGTVIEFVCDGTNWYLSGTVHSDTSDGVTWADQ